MSVESQEQRQTPNFGANELGEIKFQPYVGRISGLSLSRSIDDSFIIGNYQTGDFLKLQFLFWNNTQNEERITIATYVVKNHFQFQPQQHVLSLGKLYQLENTDIRLVARKKILASGPFEVGFTIDAPRNIPIVRAELIDNS